MKTVEYIKLKSITEVSKEKQIWNIIKVYGVQMLICGIIMGLGIAIIIVDSYN